MSEKHLKATKIDMKYEDFFSNIQFFARFAHQILHYTLACKARRKCLQFFLLTAHFTKINSVS